MKNLFKNTNKKDKEFKSVLSNETIRIRSMTITSIMLGFYAIFAFFGNSYFPIPFLGNFLNMDISLVFLIPLVFICNAKWWLSAAVISGFFNFLWAGAGGYVGALFNIVLNTLTLTSFFISKCLIIKKLTNIKLRILILLFVNLLTVILMNCTLNGLFFTPLYWMTYQIIKTPFFIEASNVYNNSDSLKSWLLFIPDYWTGIFGLYSAFNLLKFGVICLLLFPILIVIYKSNIVNSYFY